MTPLGLFAFFLISPVFAASSKEFDPNSGYLYVDEETVPNAVEDVLHFPSNENLDIHPRWKRATSSDIDTSIGFHWKDFPGTNYMRKLRKLFKDAKNLPPPIKEAIASGDFSNITADDVREVNVTILEYIPPKAMAKMNHTVLEQIMSILLKYNLPNALGRLVEVAGNKISPVTILDRINTQRSQTQATPQSILNEGASVLLYSAMSHLGEIGGITAQRINQLKRFDLLKYVPEEQFMKINDSTTAKHLLENLYGKSSVGAPEQNEPDDKALVYKLLETQHGKPGNWSGDTIRTVASSYLRFLPAAAIKQFTPENVASSIFNLRDDGKFDNPLQAKTVTDLFLEKSGFHKNEDGVFQGNSNNLPNILGQLQKLTAFLNPATTNNAGQLNSIISECDKWNLPAPLQAVNKYLKATFKGKSVNSLTRDDLNALSPDVLKNSPPEVIGRAMDTHALDEFKSTQMGKFGNSTKREGIYGNAFFKGLIAQLASFVVSKFKQTNLPGNKYHMDRIPSSFLTGIGVKGIQEMDGHQLQNLLLNLRENPNSNALDDEQKALLLKRLRDESLLDGSRIPPDLTYLRSRIKGKEINVEDLEGFTADSELRLAHSVGKSILPGALERDPNLIGTLTPKQVESVDIQFIPGILAAIRRSKDGPQPQTLKALSKRYAEYIRLKSDDYDSDDKKLLKYVTAAEVSKLPASVLAYFVDRRQTSKLPPAVRKEIMIALGEMSTKDRTLIPDKTREQIILHGLEAIDETLDREAKYGVQEIAAIGHAVGDLPQKVIHRLNPVAFEQALDMIQGTTEEDEGLKQRACLNPTQKKAWRDKIVEAYGKPKLWDPATVTTLCCALPLLTEDDLMTLDKESIVTCQCISDGHPPAHLAELKKSLDKSCEKRLGKVDETKKVFERVRAERAMDLNDLESQILTRKKRAHAHGKHKRGLSCFAVRLARTPVEFDHDTLATLKAKDIRHCLHELGSVKLGQAEERLLWEKLVEANGGQVRSIPADQLRNAAFILTGIKAEEVNDLNFADDDVLAAFGRSLGFPKHLLARMADRIEMVRKRNDYQPADLIIIRNILCGFELDTLQRIVPEAFSLALPILRQIEPTCELSHLSTLANIATHDKVYGDPANWTAADVRGVGILLKGLSVNKIPAEAFLGMSPYVAGALGDNTLKELTPQQVSFIPKFSAEAMSESQINSLSSAGRDVLDATIRGPLVTDGSLRSFNPPYTTVVFTLAVATVSVWGAYFL